jgi:hypothetical protein
MVLFTVKLRGNLFFQKIIVFQFQKNLLSDFRLQLGCSAAKNVETEVEPLVYPGVEGMVLVA